MARTAPVAISGSDQQLVASGRTLLGFSFEETGNVAAATVYIRAGGATGTIVARSKLASGGADRVWFGPDGIWCEGGVYIDVGGTGTAAGAVYLR